MNPIDREGYFTARPLACGLKPAKEDSGSESVSVCILFKMLTWYDAESKEELPWEEYDQQGYCDTYIVGKDGSTNERSVETLVAAFGWDGSLELWSRPCALPDCRVTVKSDEYKEDTPFRIAWINPLDGRGGLNKMDEAGRKSLAAKHGSKFRAIAGNMRRSTAPAPAIASNVAPTVAPSEEDTPF